MFNVGGGELIVIMLIALIVLGPQRLPGAARQIGKTMGDLRRLSTGFQNEVRSALNDADDPDRVAARRNVLAKEAPRSPADTEITAPAEGAADGPEPEPERVSPARRTPLKAAPPSSPKRATKNGTPVKAAKRRTAGSATGPVAKATKGASGAKGTSAKKPAARKAAVKKAPSKAAARRDSS